MFVGALCGLTETATATVINTTISVYAAPLAGNRSSATAAAFSAYRGLFCMGFILLSLLGAWQSPTSLSPATALAARVAPPLIIGVLFVISTALALRTASRLPELMQASRAAHPHGSRTVSPADASVISGGGAIMMMAAAAARANDGDDDEEDSEDFALKSFTPTPLDPTLGGGWTNGVPIKSGEVDVATLPVMAGKDELAPVSPNSSNLRATGARVARMLESSGLRVMGAAQQTVRMVAGGDFVALASSGGGRAMGRGIAVAHAHRDDVADDDEEEDLADHAMHLQ
ncbi:hypothetical protein BC828DRAFT_386198 [Blastocladiella britannica]|nr:hypothetical protein BC828DRAFT_386198 [Blastocladiella britannica]